MTHIGFVTYSEYPNLIEADQLLAQALRAQSITCTPVIWNDPTIAWEQFDMLVVRSTWDYFEYVDDFRAWLAQVESQTQVWNSPATIRWNMAKTYLRDLANNGVNIVPTHWLEQGQTVNLQNALETLGWTEAVVKPVISAGAENTWRTSLADALIHQDQFQADINARATMLQPFMTSIQEQGEWSFIFFNSQFSHSVLKQPAPSDFRVQLHHGGKYAGATAPSQLIDQAHTIIEAIDTDWLYVRVDAVVIDDKLALMELEMIEPYLFLDVDPLAPERFAQAILARL